MRSQINMVTKLANDSYEITIGTYVGTPGNETLLFSDSSIIKCITECRAYAQAEAALDTLSETGMLPPEFVRDVDPVEY